MQVPLEVSYRNVDKSEAIEKLINSKVAKLEKTCDYMTSCRIAIERRHKSQQSGNPYRVRIEMRIPPNHSLVVKRTSVSGQREEPLQTLLRKAFESAHRQLKQLVEKQRGEVKFHPYQEIGAIVEKLFPEEGYGFARTLDGLQLYFHRNSVLRGDFDRIRIGTGVRYTAEQGADGLQASSLEIVDQRPET